MIVEMKGQVVTIGASEFPKGSGTLYPHFDLLQLGDKAEIVRVSGNGVAVGQNLTFTARVYLDDRKNIKVKKQEPKAAEQIKK